MNSNSSVYYNCRPNRRLISKLINIILYFEKFNASKYHSFTHIEHLNNIFSNELNYSEGIIIEILPTPAPFQTSIHKTSHALKVGGLLAWCICICVCVRALAHMLACACASVCVRARASEGGGGICARPMPFGNI